MLTLLKRGPLHVWPSEYSTGREDYAVHVALWERQSAQTSGIVAACVSVPERGEIWTMTDQREEVDHDSRPIRIMVSRSRPPHHIEGLIHNLDQAFPHRGVAVHRGFVVCDVQGNEIALNQEHTKLKGAIVCRPEFESIVLKSLA